MKLSVIIPCYNEEKTIRELLGKVEAAQANLQEIIVVDDASSDGTREILKEKERSQSTLYRVFFHESNQGKGAAIRTGIAHLTGDLVVIQDADLEYSPQDYPKLLQPFYDDQADVVFGSRFGSRFMGGSAHRVLFFWHMVANRLLTLVSNIFSNLNLTDMETGMKMFRREILQSIKIEENRFGFEPEITAKVAKMGCRIYEVGISYHGRTYQEGKKITWKDGIKAFWAIFKYNMKA